jgi:hypothetical protein
MARDYDGPDAEPSAVGGAITPTDSGARYLAFSPLAWVVLRFAHYALIRWLRARLAVAVIRRGRRVDWDG